MSENNYPYFVLATIWEHIEPIDRGERYEDPLIDALYGIGDVVGGGSQFAPETGIEFVNIEIELADLDSVPLVKSTLEAQGAPKGSELQYTMGDEEAVDTFGVTECLAVFLDGVNLPDEVYAAADIEDLAQQLIAAIGETGEFRASWMGETETSLEFFGPDAEEMFQRTEQILTTYPLCQNARVVVRKGKDSVNPREVRMPMSG